MNLAIFESYRRLLTHFPPGEDVLEIGAKPDPNRALSALLPHCNRTVINLKAPSDPSRMPEVRFLQGNANDLNDLFPAGSFDAVLSNAVMEHDRYFWKTVAEVRRVLRQDGLFFVGMPGFPRSLSFRGRLMRWTKAKVSASPFPRMATIGMIERGMAVRTFPFHPAPDDFYRFSEQAVRKVILEGFEVLTLEYVLDPVRILAVGRKL